MLRSVFYSEFDNITGPVVRYDAPVGVMSEKLGDGTSRAGGGGSRGGEVGSSSAERCSLFDAISDYSITGAELSGHLLTISVPAFGVQVIIHPRPPPKYTPPTPIHPNTIAILVVVSPP